MATTRRMTYRIVQNKDTCPRSRLKRDEGAGYKGQSVHARRHCNGARSRAQASRRQELFSQVPGSPLWAPRALTRAGARSVVDEFSLLPASLPLQKNVSIQRPRLIQTPVFIAAASGRSFVFARAHRDHARVSRVAPLHASDPLPGPVWALFKF